MQIKENRFLKTFLDREHFLIDLFFILSCGLSLYFGIRTTGDFEWGLDNYDLSRDLSNAQAIFHHEFFKDPVYIGETMWYNPLVPSVIAFLSMVTRLPINIIHARAGAYLNLLVPIAFYIMSITLFRNRKIGLTATLGFLFVGKAPNLYPWIFATYSPWLLPIIFTQALFYLTFTTLVISNRTNQWKWYILTGFLWGLTFLGHTAPAVIIGGVIIYLILLELFSIFRLFSHASLLSIIKLASTIIISALISTPYWMPILLHYRFRSLNFEPGSWTPPLLELPNIIVFLKSNLSLINFFALIGIIGLWNNKKVQKNNAIKLLMAWGIVATTGLVFEFLRQLINFPSLVSGIHALAYFRSFSTVLFGYGIIYLVQLCSKWIKPLYQYQSFGYIFIIISVIFFSLPSYMTRFEFTTLREAVKLASQQENKLNVITWIQENTNPDDVFLAKHSEGLPIVAPTGRKLVVVNSYFSNPYVDWGKRNRDNNLMYKYLVKDRPRIDRQHFIRLINAYNVKYVIYQVPSSPILERYPIKSVFANEKYEIFLLIR